MTKTQLLGLTFSALLATQANAALITGTTASVVAGGLWGATPVARIVDGVFPGEGDHYMNNTAVWGTGTPSMTATLQVDLGAVYTLEDLLVSVDNNDSYEVTYSENGQSFSSLFTIAFNLGEIGSGMDTFSTDASHAEYVAAIDFAAVNARYLRVRELSGDGRYSVGEIQAFGSPLTSNDQHTVPVPSTLSLVGIGALAFGLRRRKA
ncbi:MAG: discoidin domain-containing protein [Rhodoferax sp.]|nr:discoidin domain-containing protein [Rhodoferax sp.]